MMATRSATFLDILRQSQLLGPQQLAQLLDQESRWGDLRALAQELVTRNWLTPYQVNRLLKGRGADLILGPYLVLERLGEGGTGQVFKARHQRMNRVVALKVIRPELLTDAEVVNRFLREIQVVSQLSHPNVVHAYDAGPVGSTYFLAMEYIDGTDLAALVRDAGPLPVAQACDYLRQAALGLQHAHERGLIHRDIKPPNFLLAQPGRAADSRAGSASRWGVIKLLDLGLARLQRSSVDGERTSMLTPAGSVTMGTPDYLAPEQALDFHSADIRADIYGLGCTGYYLLTGQPPFPGGTLAQKLLRHQQAECPAVEQQRADVPPEVAALLRRLLAKRPEDRPQTPQEVADELGNLLRKGRPASAGTRSEQDDRTMVGSMPADLAISTVPRSPAAKPARLEKAPRPVAVEPQLRRRRFRRLPYWLGVTVVVLLGLLILPAVLLFRHNLAVPAAPSEPKAAVQEPKAPRDWKDVLAAWSDPRTDREQLRPALLRCLQTEAGTAQAAQAAALLWQLPSPLDRLDRMALPPGRQFVKEQVAIVGKVRTHAGPGRHCVAFSADGLWLANGGEDGKIRLWRTQDLSTALVISAHQSSVRELLFAPDGQSLVSVAGGESTPVVWDLTDTVPRERARLVGHTGAVRALAFNRDGKTLASASMDSTVRLWDLSRRTCPERGQLPHKDRVLALAYSPDGTTLASSSADLAIRLWDPSRSTADARTVLPGLPGDNARLAYLADGKGLIAAGAGGDWALRVGELTGGDKSPAVWGIKGRNILTIALSADGQVLAVCFGNGELSLYNPKTGLKRFEWRWSHAVHSLDFAPDSRHLAIATHDGLIAILRFADLPKSSN